MRNSIRKAASRFVSPLRLNAREFLDYHALQRLERQVADFSVLGHLSKSEIAGFLEDPTIAKDWLDDRKNLDAVNPPDFASGVNPGDQLALYSFVRALKPKRILEVGTHIGSSTLAMALACRRNVSDEVLPKIVTVDIRDVNDEETKPWIYFGSDASPRKKLRQLDLERLVDFRVGDSLQVLAHETNQFDFVFLDGSHRAPTLYREIPAAIRALVNGAILVMHDVFPYCRPLWPKSRPTPGPWQAASRLVSENDGLQLYPLGELPWPTKLGSNRTSLAVLSKV